MYFCQKNINILTNRKNEVYTPKRRWEKPCTRRPDRDRARSDRDPDIYARRYAGCCQVAAYQGRERGCESTDHPGQYLSPLPAARHRGAARGRRTAQVQRLGPPDPHRQRRLPGLLAEPPAQDQPRRGRLVPVAHRRLAAPLQPGEGDGHRARHRSRHHHGLRPIPPTTSTPKTQWRPPASGSTAASPV